MTLTNKLQIIFVFLFVVVLTIVGWLYYFNHSMTQHNNRMHFFQAISVHLYQINLALLNRNNETAQKSYKQGQTLLKSLPSDYLDGHDRELMKIKLSFTRIGFLMDHLKDSKSYDLQAVHRQIDHEINRTFNGLNNLIELTYLNFNSFKDQTWMSVLFLFILVIATLFLVVFIFYKGFFVPLIHLGKQVTLVGQGVQENIEPSEAMDEVGQLSQFIAQLLYELHINHKDLQMRLQMQQTISKIQKLSWEEEDLTSFLQRSLKIISKVSFVNEVDKSSIFLIDPRDQNNLKLVAHHNFDERIVSSCQTVAKGHCICGLAFERMEAIYKSSLDHDHVTEYEGMKPHGHFCTPILASPTHILGVLNVYLSDGHIRNEVHELFLNNVADSLSAIIVRKNVLKEKTQMQAQLVQSAKLATVGTLASGVAHELNNPLAIVKGYADYLLDDPEGMEEAREPLENIVKASLRMRSIVDHLRTFARESKEEERSYFHLVDPIYSTFKFFSTQFSLLEIAHHLEVDDSLLIYGDVNQMESVFQNLVVNSRDAFKEINDGRAKEIFIVMKVENDQVVTTYKDNATGMDQQILNNLFDPFFTTKETGKGTGLGMSITRNIIEMHRGEISAHSQKGQGTEFVISLPLIQMK